MVLMAVWDATTDTTPQTLHLRHWQHRVIIKVPHGYWPLHTHWGPASRRVETGGTRGHQLPGLKKTSRRQVNQSFCRRAKQPLLPHTSWSSVFPGCRMAQLFYVFFVLPLHIDLVLVPCVYRRVIIIIVFLLLHLLLVFFSFYYFSFLFLSVDKGPQICISQLVNKFCLRIMWWPTF